MKIKLLFALVLLTNLLFAKDIYVSNVGSHKGKGTKQKPYTSLEDVKVDLEKYAGRQPVTVWFEEGVYYFSETLLLDPKSSGNKEYPIQFQPVSGAEVVIKGSVLLDELKWKEYGDGIYVSDVTEDLDFDQLFVDGQRQIRARFPNHDYDNPIRGGKGYLNVTGGTNARYDEWFSFDPNTFTTKDWKNPTTGIVHAFQSHNWGNMQYRIERVDKVSNKVMLGEGGWQLQRHYGIGGKGTKSSAFFIDNIFEELDVAQEWFLDTEDNKLYYYPKQGANINELIFEAPIIENIVAIVGDKESPVTHVSFRGFTFTQTKSTFMSSYEPVARGDWAIHRGGAVFIEGAEHCTIEDCHFDYVGGNGIFMSSYNRYNSVKYCQFTHTGESGVCFVGLPSAVRFYQTWDDAQILGKNWMDMRKDMDLEPGPKTPDYPENCVVENCIMHDFGDYGKQVAGVYISMSHKIRVSHNTIYNCPRAGICINDGTWGGHIIEYCDIWETVRETGEHGPFNSWGRERQWVGSRGKDHDFIKEYTKLDAIDNVVVRNNRISNYRKSISAGNWTIDLDDGSSYFEIYNNLNLGSTIKLRDGMSRKVYNNITVSAVPLGWHVWPKESEDEIYQNVFVVSGAVPGKKEPTAQFIRDIGLPNDCIWSTNHNNNLFWNINYPENPQIIKGKDLQEWQAKGYDINSKIAKPMFIDPLNGDYRLSEESLAMSLGFKNFPMDQFGHEMTRIIPFGADFENNQKVKLKADIRMTDEGTIRYTLDGTLPEASSPIYTGELIFEETTHIIVASFDKEGRRIGFVNDAWFYKVANIEYPSWLQTLLDGKYTGELQFSKQAKQALVNGALLIDIADDPDLIDASGGYNYGCYIKSIDNIVGTMWTESGLSSGWTIQMVNGNKVMRIQDLKNILNDNLGNVVEVTASRNYTTVKFSVKTK